MQLDLRDLADLLQLPPGAPPPSTSGSAGRGPPPNLNTADMKTALHPSGEVLALAVGQRLALVGLAGGAHAEDAQMRALDVCTAPEHVTDIAWLAFARTAAADAELEDSCLLVGTSGGQLQLRAPAGGLLAHQPLHDKPLARIRPRAAGGGLAGEGDGAEDVTLVFPDALVRLSALELRSVVRYQAQHWVEQARVPRMAFNKWTLPKGTGPRCDGLCLGVKPPSLYAALTARDGQPKLALLAGGTSPALAALEANERSERGALALVGELASSVANGLFGLAKTAVTGRERGLRQGLRSWVMARVVADAPPPSAAPPPDKKEELPPGEPAPLVRALADQPRAVTTLLAAPRGALAVAADSLGRVLLVDTAVMAVVRMWKAYRDAQCAWLLIPQPPAAARAAQPAGTPPDQLADAGRQAAASPTSPAEGARLLVSHPVSPADVVPLLDADSSADEGGSAASSSDMQDGAVSGSNRKRKAAQTPRSSSGGGGGRAARSPGALPQLCLVLYAPRRSVVEVWAMRHGPRVASLPAGPNCRMLGPGTAFGLAPHAGGSGGGGAAGAGGASGAGGAAGWRSDCWMLDFDSGRMWNLSAQVRAQVAGRAPAVPAAAAEA